jgi:hypothetical protein
MSPNEMTTQVDAELRNIPKSEGAQNLLRVYYNIARRQSLGKNVSPKPSAKKVLLDCIDKLRRTNPDVDLHYDKSFFETA